MSAPVYLAGVAVCTKFATPALRRACVAHRLSTLERYVAGSRRTERCRYRSYATLVGNSPPAFEQDKVARRPTDVGQDAPHSSQNEQRSSTQNAVHESIKQLDPYLPLEGRSGTWLENLATFEGVRSPRSLSNVLQAIDQNFKHGALASLALEQGRWRAYVYLIEGLMKAYTTFRSSLTTDANDRSIWSKVELPPPGIHTSYGRQQFYPKTLRLSGQENEELEPFQVPSSLGTDDIETLHNFQYAVGKVWQSLGSIVIEAAELDHEQSEKLMSNVHHVLSIMHSEDWMHPMIYQFDQPDVAEIRRKSPYLQSMSSRMMTTISDSTWKAVEDKVIDSYTWMSTAYAEAEGLELKDLYPTVRKIGHEAWLDLILWSCVLGSHNTSGMSIVREMAARQGGSQWRSITWQDLLEENMHNTDAINAKRLRDRFDKVAGAFEGYSSDPPILTLPPRTISSEVVVALIESVPSSSGHPFQSNVAQELSSLKHLLNTSNQNLDRQFWKLVAIRAVDSGSINPELQPSILQSISDAVTLRSRSTPQPTLLQQTDIDEQKGLAEVHGLFSHRALAALVNMGDINGALKAFLKLQSWVDEKKQGALQSFFSTSLSVVESRSTNVDLLDVNESQDLHAAPIPASTMASFLDLLTKYRLFDLGMWLLASNDPDGPIISHSVRTSSVFMPALIRFGVALKEYRIVEEILNHIGDDRSLLTSELLHALLAAYVEFKQFDRVTSILRVIRDEHSEPVSAEEVMTLARQLMRLERKNGAEARAQAHTVSRILADILQRKYLGDCTQDPQALRAQRDHLHQLYRILSSVGGQLANLPLDMENFEAYRATSPVSVEAFNTFLKGVVESQGPEAGRELVERWCVLPSRERTPQLFDSHDDMPVLVRSDVASKLGLALPMAIDPHQGGGDQVVQPNKYTIHIIMDAAINLREEEQPKPDKEPISKLGRPMIRWEEDEPSTSRSETSEDENCTVAWCRATLKKLQV